MNYCQMFHRSIDQNTVITIFSLMPIWLNVHMSFLLVKYLTFITLKVIHRGNWELI